MSLSVSLTSLPPFPLPFPLLYFFSLSLSLVHPPHAVADCLLDRHGRQHDTRIGGGRLLQRHKACSGNVVVVVVVVGGGSHDWRERGRWAACGADWHPAIKASITDSLSLSLSPLSSAEVKSKTHSHRKALLNGIVLLGRRVRVPYVCWTGRKRTGDRRPATDDRRRTTNDRAAIQPPTRQPSHLKMLSSTTNDLGAMKTAKNAASGPRPTKRYPRTSIAAIGARAQRRSPQRTLAAQRAGVFALVGSNPQTATSPDQMRTMRRRISFQIVFTGPCI